MIIININWFTASVLDIQISMIINIYKIRGVRYNKMRRISLHITTNSLHYSIIITSSIAWSKYKQRWVKELYISDTEPLYSIKCWRKGAFDLKGWNEYLNKGTADTIRMMRPLIPRIYQVSFRKAYLLAATNIPLSGVWEGYYQFYNKQDIFSFMEFNAYSCYRLPIHKTEIRIVSGWNIIRIRWFDRTIKYTTV